MTRVVATLLLLTCWLPTARAWEDTREIIHGSARVLEKGETIVGIVSPLAYGLVERFTVFTHPALLLLLTPNIWARLSLMDTANAVALETGYQQSLLVLEFDDTSSSDANGDPMPGYFQLGAIYSRALSKRVQLTAAAGYVVRFGSFTTDLQEHNSGLYYRLGGQVLFGELNLLLAEVRGSWFGGSLTWPTASLIFARQLGRTRIGVGAVAGQFPISTDFQNASDPRSSAGGDHVTLPVYPWVDLWWRF
jgi:hypothetical protein